MARRLLLLGEASSTHVQRWARHFAASDWEVHVASLRPGVIPDVTVHRLAGYLPGRLGYLTVIPQLRRLGRALAPALVHAHYATSYGLLGALLGRHPLLVSVWGSDVYEWPHQGPLHAALLRFVLSCADAIGATSEDLARATRPYAPAATRIRVTPFGVDTDRFHPGEPEAGPLVIGSVRTHEHRYGLDLLIRAFAALDRPDTRLLLVGSGPQAAAYRALVAELGLTERVELPGAVPPDELPALYRRMAVFVAPSRIEAFCVAAVEAGASGLPAVVTRVGGLPEVVADGQTGLVVPPEDVEALTRALRQLVDEPATRARMGAAARERVLERYRWADNAAGMAALYQELLAPARP